MLYVSMCKLYFEILIIANFLLHLLLERSIMQFIGVLKIQRCKDSVHGGRIAHFASYGVWIGISLEGLHTEGYSRTAIS